MYLAWVFTYFLLIVFCICGEFSHVFSCFVFVASFHMFSVERWAEVATPSRPFATQPQLRRSYKLRVSQSILGEKNTNLKTRTSGDIFYILQALVRAPPQTERKSKNPDDSVFMKQLRKLLLQYFAALQRERKWRRRKNYEKRMREIRLRKWCQTGAPPPLVLPSNKSQGFLLFSKTFHHFDQIFHHFKTNLKSLGLQ